MLPLLNLLVLLISSYEQIRPDLEKCAICTAIYIDVLL